MLLRLACFLLLAITVTLSGCGKKKPIADAPKSSGTSSVRSAPEPGDTRGQIKNVVDSENLVTSFSPLMKELVRSFRDPGVSLKEFALPAIEYRGISNFDFKKEIGSSLGDENTGHLTWPLMPDGNFESIDIENVWAPLLQQHRFESCQIGTIGTRFVETGFQMDTKFEGRFKTDGQTVGVKAYQTIEWREGKPGSWEIAKWNQTDFQLVFAAKTLFADVTKEVIPDAKTLEQVQRSKHQEMIVDSANASVLKIPPLRKEYKDLKEINDVYKEYKNVVDNIQGSKEILDAEEDPEMKEMAKLELDELLPKKVAMEEEIKIMLN